MLDGITQQVEEDALEKPHIGLYRQLFFSFVTEIPVSVGKTGHPFANRSRKVESSDFQGHVSAFNLSEIEDVVDELAQNIHIAPGHQKRFSLGLLHMALQHVVQRPGHQRERCAEVVAHSRKEFQLGLGGFFQLLFEPAGIPIVPVGLARNQDKQEGKTDDQPHDDALVVIL